ncbi:hypothetical protein WICPIJ_006649 [Wickerhamomyces pijperi]|uniref:Uncharacterized protein n=1 Tax=Wickerhamomyces pijperi TaxID=599730 RepID=A0A9P8TKT9_WICPI|nr:hypothetical protein WICPIJ_006649 [Wickerhamomyces pijperi]
MISFSKFFQHHTNTANQNDVDWIDINGLSKMEFGSVEISKLQVNHTNTIESIIVSWICELFDAKNVLLDLLEPISELESLLCPVVELKVFPPESGCVSLDVTLAEVNLVCLLVLSVADVMAGGLLKISLAVLIGFIDDVVFLAGALTAFDCFNTGVVNSSLSVSLRCALF